MFGVTVENNDFGKIAKLGYRIVENSTDGFSTETEIISEDEIIHAKISLCGKDGLLHLVIEDEAINNIKWVEIISTNLMCCEGLTIQAEDIHGNEILREVGIKG